MIAVEEKKLITSDKWRRFVENKDRLDRLLIKSFKDAGIKKEHNRMETCGTFIYAQQCQKCETKHFKGYNRCKSRWCPNCAYVKRLMWLARLLPLLEKERLKDNKIIKLNLTIQDGDNLRDKLIEMEKAWRNLYNGRGGRDIWKYRVIGGIRSLEVKLGLNSGSWHPHYHLILVTRPEFNKDIAWILPRWKEMLNSECGTCDKLKTWTEKMKKGEKTDNDTDIRGLCHECDKNRGSAWIKSVKNDLDEILEAVKYIVKPDKEVFEKNNLIEAYRELNNKRQINTFGSFRGLVKQIKQDEKEEKRNLTEIENFVCQVCGFTKSEFRTYIYNTIKNEMVVDFIKK